MRSALQVFATREADLPHGEFREAKAVTAALRHRPVSPLKAGPVAKAADVRRQGRAQRPSAEAGPPMGGCLHMGGTRAQRGRRARCGGRARTVLDVQPALGAKPRPACNDRGRNERSRALRAGRWLCGCARAVGVRERC